MLYPLSMLDGCRVSSSDIKNVNTFILYLGLTFTTRYSQEKRKHRNTIVPAPLGIEPNTN